MNMEVNTNKDTSVKKILKQAAYEAENQKFIKIRKHLHKKLDPMRYEHTLGVAYTCVALAMRYGYDLEKAELAGLLHDCAKRYDEVTIIKKCRENGLALTDCELAAPATVHAKLGAWMAEHKYGISDPEIMQAIACHTTGKPDMGLLDKILYVADYIEPRRDKAPRLPEMRKMAFLDLDETLYQIMKGTLEYLKKYGAEIDDMTRVAFEYYDARRMGRIKETAATAADSGTLEKIEEVSQNDTGRRNGKNCRKGSGRQKRRRYQNH